MSQLPLLLKGSVKNILGVEGQAPYIFEYSDRYSVFDWGEMPDMLEEKGKSLAKMAWLFFDLLGRPSFWRDWNLEGEIFADLKKSGEMATLKENGAFHHSLSEEKDAELNQFKVEPMAILRPPFEDGSWDYSVYKEKKVTKTLVPLEVIFRFDITDGSSLLKRVGNTAYCDSLGLQKIPEVGDHFESPVIEFSTKLESTDRYITPAEAQTISGMSEIEIGRLKKISSLLALRLKDLFAGVDVNLLDGKFEFAFSPELDSDGERDFMLIDSIGPDELRLTYKGVQLSKESFRKVYRKTDWYKSTEKSKELATQRGTKDWKKICQEELNSSPENLDTTALKTGSMIYKGLCNELFIKYFGKNAFEDAWTLDQVITELEKEYWK